MQCTWNISFNSVLTLTGTFWCNDSMFWSVCSGPNFIELLKHKILLKLKNPCLVKSDYRPRLHSIVMLSEQQLNTSHNQCIWRDILASNMCKISELFSCFSKIFALWNWPQITFRRRWFTPKQNFLLSGFIKYMRINLAQWNSVRNAPINNTRKWIMPILKISVFGFNIE